MNRRMQWTDEHGAAQAQPVRAGRRIGHQFERGERSCRAEDLLLGPGALETELLGSSQVGAERVSVEALLAYVLGDGDREAHS